MTKVKQDFSIFSSEFGKFYKKLLQFYQFLTNLEKILDFFVEI